MMYPFVVVLWEHVNFGGRRRYVPGAPAEQPRAYGYCEADLVSLGFNDTTSSIQVYRGPDYSEWKARYGEPYLLFCEHSCADARASCGGRALHLGVGNYPDLHAYRWGDCISSIHLADAPRVATPEVIPPSPGSTEQAFRRIPIAAVLFTDAQMLGRHIWILTDCANMIREFGGECNDVISSAIVLSGSGFADGNAARLYRDVDFKGGEIALRPGDYDNLHRSHGFGDVVSSVRVS